MEAYTIGRLVRTLRHRMRFTQQQLAERSGVKRWKMVKLEAGDIARLRFVDLDRCLAALGARLDVRAWYQGAAAERVLDELHAVLVGVMVRLLLNVGWEVRVEVSFATYRERGSIDILAWHPVRRVLLVLEIKSELGSIREHCGRSTSSAGLPGRLPPSASGGIRLLWAASWYCLKTERRAVPSTVTRLSSMLHCPPVHAPCVRGSPTRWATLPASGF